MPAANIAAFDLVGGTWEALGTGIDGGVYGLIAASNGDLVAGGTFTTAGGVAANRVARWDGTAWHAMGGGLDGTVGAFAVLGNGDLVAGGDFATVGGVPFGHVARWDGQTWSPIGGGTNGSVACLLASGAGFVAGGQFVTAGGTVVNRIAQWDGSAWVAMGGGVSGVPAGSWWQPGVQSLLRLPTGSLLVGGFFLAAGGVPVRYLASWDGTSWSAVGPPVLVGIPSRMALAANGDLITNAVLSYGGGSTTSRLSRWDGVSWTPVPAGPDDVVASLTVLPNGHLAVGGAFEWGDVYGVEAWGIATWDGAIWSALGPGFTSGTLSAITVLPDGDLLGVGLPVASLASAGRSLWRWDGTAWSQVSTALTPGMGYLTAMPNGDIVAGGWFPTVAGVVYNHVARWDGTTWSPMGVGFPAGGVRALCTMADGTVVAGGSFTASGTTATIRVARWNGTSWVGFGSGVGSASGDSVFCLASGPHGDLFVAGHFHTAGGYAAANIARYGGNAWHALGGGLDGDVHALTILANGELVAGGAFMFADGQPASHIARWDGAQWRPLGAGLDGRVLALASMPDGDLVACGEFLNAGGASARYVARWDGVSWSSLGAGPDSPPWVLGRREGDLWFSGLFLAVGTTVSARLARYASTCPASAATLSGGCASTGGNNTLVATRLPWSNGTLRTVASGLPNDCIAIATTGFTALPPGSTPLSALHPLGVVGCELRVGPDIQQVLITDSGMVQSELFVPASPSLTGSAFYHQMIAIEVDATGAFVAITATNALQLTVGDF